MQIIFGTGKHLFVWEFKAGRVAMRSSNDEEPEDNVGIDPHGTVSAHMEISPDAIGAYGKQRFGFHGSENSGDEES